jgi:ABC-2 type transport system permease protein
LGFNKYVEVGKISLSNSLVYLMDFLAKSLFIGLIIFIFINLWKVVYGDSTSLIDGFTINMMVWYLVMTESIVTSQGKLLEEIGEEIRSGNIAQSLNKPYNFIVFKYASGFGNTFLRFIMTFTIGAIITLIFVGGINVQLVHLPLILLTVLFALTINFLMMALLGIFAFWLEDARALHFIYQKFVFVLGGMLLPLELFPQWLGDFSRVLPFSYVAYHPAKLWVMFNWSDFVNVIMNQLFWIVIFIITIALVYRICIEKISINGG